MRKSKEMSSADLIYNDVIRDILNHGIWDTDQEVRPKWVDGSPAYTKGLISKQMMFDGHEVPILTTKRVAWKTAIHELIWFYIKRTSDVSYLRENNVKIWEEWTRENGTIGKAYGYQLGKKIPDPYTVKATDSGAVRITSFEHANQVHNLIDGLKKNPASRRHVISLWNIDDLWDMSLYPCVWHSQWLVKEGKLHGIVGIRSNDMALGNPFNTFQYYVLQRMLCQVTGYEIGTLTFNINDAHVYERHVDPLREQMKREPFAAPTLLLDPDVKNFDDFTIKSFHLAGYDHHPSIPMEVAI
jgi:thymidylate synthase